MGVFRILVADDHEIVRAGLVSLLKGHEGWEICGQASNGREAVALATELKPDAVILDVGMPSLNGLEAARQILRINPGIKILILTMTDADQLAQAALDAGARAFILKTDASRDLVAAVEALQANRTFFTARVQEMLLGKYLTHNPRGPEKDLTLSSITPREREIVQLLAEGKSTKEVAAVLDLSVKTAETHRSNIMRKLRLHSTSELVLYAIRNRIVQVPPNPVEPRNDH
jgi:DNA-binding NarL/FixJ family response regulator